MARRYPTPAQQRTLWNALTALAIVILGAFLVGIVWLGGRVLAYLQPVLVPLAMAGIIAYLLEPVVEWLRSKKFSLLQAIGTVFAGFAILLIVMGIIIVRPLLSQVADLRENFDTHVEKLEETGKEWAEKPVLRPLAKLAFAHDEETGRQSEQLRQLKAKYEEGLISQEVWNEQQRAILQSPETSAPPAGEEVLPAEEEIDFRYKGSRLEKVVRDNAAAIQGFVLKGLQIGGGKLVGLLGYALGFLMVPVYLFFFLKDSASIQARWADYVPIKRSRFKREVVETLTEMNKYLIAFFRGQVLVSLIDGLLTGIALQIMGLPYAIVIGLALAFLGVMPFIGFLVTLIPAMLIAAVTWGDWRVFAVLAIFVVVQQIDGLFIQPKIVGDSVGLHPMTIIFSILFWSLLLGGFLGALLAIPLTASVKVLFTRYVWDRRLHASPEDGSSGPDPPLKEAPA